MFISEKEILQEFFAWKQTLLCFFTLFSFFLRWLVRHPSLSFSSLFSVPLPLYLFLFFSVSLHISLTLPLFLWPSPSLSPSLPLFRSLFFSLYPFPVLLFVSHSHFSYILNFWVPSTCSPWFTDETVDLTLASKFVVKTKTRKVLSFEYGYVHGGDMGINNLTIE